MQCLKKAVKLKTIAADGCLLDVKNPVYTQVAMVMKLKMPPNFDDVEFPMDTRRRLKVLDKVPQTLSSSVKLRTMRKSLYLMRGPEQVHNKILYGEFGIQATSGGRMNHGHIEAVRIKIARNLVESRMFSVWRIDAPWQAVSKKGISHRMGGGKAAINKFVVPIKPDRMILEIGGKCEFTEVKNFLVNITQMLPFKSRVVTRELMEKEREKEEKSEEMNRNPFTFKYAAEHNMLGIDKYLSPYDYKWFGKYR